MGCFFSIHQALDGRKVLRRLDDTDLPCDKSSNSHNEERTSVEHSSNTKSARKEVRAKKATPRLRAERISKPTKLGY